jgi:hypothetical protein
MKRKKYFWLREGDNDNYHRFSSLDEIDTSLWGLFHHWTDYGLATGQLNGDNYISLFVGNEDAQRIRQLNQVEKTFIKKQITF